MKNKIMMMSLLQIPTGHYHVAESIQVKLAKESDDFIFEQIDILSERFGCLEKVISWLYLQWIRNIPTSYRFIYHLFASNNSTSCVLRFYEWLFLAKMQRIVTTQKPALIICTHALPSYLLSKLKGKTDWRGVVINVYTDYFAHNVWGKTAIDYHFVPTMEMKNNLVAKGICSKRILLTGIPIHPVFQKERLSEQRNLPTVLIGGGNFGIGSLSTFLKRLRPSGKIMYKVLCGKNKTILKQLRRRANPFVEAIAYVDSKEEMNRLYDGADLIITKPGGVTIAECLQKALPIIVYDVLPGQEEENVRYLKWQGLIFYWENWREYGNLERKITTIMKKGDDFRRRAGRYQQELDVEALVRLVMEISRGNGGKEGLKESAYREGQRET